jgi:hypothetical protein
VKLGIQYGGVSPSTTARIRRRGSRSGRGNRIHDRPPRAGASGEGLDFGRLMETGLTDLPIRERGVSVTLNRVTHLLAEVPVVPDER